MIFDPESLKRFADCGIYVLDAADEMIPATLKYLGEDPDSKDPAVIAKAEPKLMAIRPYIRKFHSSENINALANGDICLARDVVGRCQDRRRSAPARPATRSRSNTASPRKARRCGST